MQLPSTGALKLDRTPLIIIDNCNFTYNNVSGPNSAAAIVLYSSLDETSALSTTSMRDTGKSSESIGRHSNKVILIEDNEHDDSLVGYQKNRADKLDSRSEFQDTGSLSEVTITNSIFTSNDAGIYFDWLFIELRGINIRSYQESAQTTVLGCCASTVRQ